VAPRLVATVRRTILTISGEPLEEETTPRLVTRVFAQRRGLQAQEPFETLLAHHPTCQPLWDLEDPSTMSSRAFLRKEEGEKSRRELGFSGQAAQTMTVSVMDSARTGTWPEWPTTYTDLAEAIRRAHAFQRAYPERRYRVEAFSSEQHGGRAVYMTLSQQS
jgi:hypothetical protein